MIGSKINSCIISLQGGGSDVTRRVCVLLCALMLLSMPLFAQEEGVDEASEQSESQDTAIDAVIDERLLLIDGEVVGTEVVDAQVIGFGDVLRMLLVLGAVVIVIYATFALLKRASRSQVRSSTLIHSLSSVPLGGNRALHLIQVGERHYLIGSAEQSVQLIEAIEDAETIDYIRQNKNATASTADDGSFKQRIRSLLSAIQKPTSSPSASAKTPSLPTSPADIMNRISNNHNRLKGM